MQADGTEKKMGAYLMKTCFQTTTISSAMFITAMAANPLAVDLAKTPWALPSPGASGLLLVCIPSPSLTSWFQNAIQHHQLG